MKFSSQWWLTSYLPLAIATDLPTASQWWLTTGPLATFCHRWATSNVIWACIFYLQTSVFTTQYELLCQTLGWMNLCVCTYENALATIQWPLPCQVWQAPILLLQAHAILNTIYDMDSYSFSEGQALQVSMVVWQTCCLWLTVMIKAISLSLSFSISVCLSLCLSVNFVIHIGKTSSFTCINIYIQNFPLGDELDLYSSLLTTEIWGSGLVYLSNCSLWCLPASHAALCMLCLFYS